MPSLRPRIKRLLLLILTKLLPVLFVIYGLLSGLLLEPNHGGAILPLQTTILLLLVFTSFGMSELLAAIDSVRIGVILGISVAPGLCCLFGALLYPRLKPVSLPLMLLPYLIDALLSFSVGNAVSAVFDLLMAAGLILLLLTPEKQEA